MEFSIKYGKETKGTLPYSSLPVYRLVCEQAGFRTHWDYKERSLHLTQNMAGKKIILISNQKDGVFSAILANIKMCLREVDVDVIQPDSRVSTSTDGEVSLQFKWYLNRPVQSPRFHILHSRDAGGRLWAKAFHREFKINRFQSTMQREAKRYPVPALELRCQLPEGMENEQEFQETIAFLFSSAIFRGLTKGNFSELFPYVSSEGLRPLLSININNDLPVVADTSLQTTKEDPISTAKDGTESNQTVSPAVSPFPMIQPLRAEVYFEHQVMIPCSENDSYLIYGNLHIKNTGLMDLINPLICLQIKPFKGIQLKGQVIPADSVGTLGVQSFNGDGAVGWRYLEEDWFKTAKQRGEYWICPIQPLRIPPGETEAFTNFQINVPKLENETFSVTGVVYFKDRDLQFMANNRIILIF